MASSDNLMAMDPSWMLRNAFPETWLPDTFSRETETFAKALQKSFETQTFDNMNFNTEFMSPWLNTSDTTTAVSVQTWTVSGGSAENETFSAVAAVVTSKQRKNGVATTAAGKISKRKSRASKRSTTTFINADAANFRQLVQQITGVKFGSAGNGLSSAVSGGGGQLLKPEPQRVNRLQLIGGGGCLPTLDTSAFLLDPTHQNNQNYQMGSASALFRQQQVTVGVSPPSAVAVDGGAASPSQFDFDSFCSFPTLESWKAV